MGPFATDREVVVQTSLYEQPDNKILYVTKSIERDDIPHIADAVRMEFYKATLLWSENGDLHMTEFTNMNLKGYFPIRLMNMVMASQT